MTSVNFYNRNTDIRGESFGDFLVLRYHDVLRDKFLCECLCGNKRVLSRNTLCQETRIRCNECRLIEKYLHNKFGTFVVIGVIPNKIGKYSTLLCKCEFCGILKENNYCNILRVKCKCTRQKREYVKTYKGYQEISADFWNRAIKGARVRNLEFAVSIKQGWGLFVKQNRKCALSGEYIFFPSKTKSPRTASLDRIDSTKGYIDDNVQWIHKRFQKMKWSSHQKDFIKDCKLVAEYHKDK